MMLFNVDAEIERQRRANTQNEEMRLVIIGNGVSGDPYADDQRIWVRDVGGIGTGGYNTPGAPYRVLAGVGPTPDIDKHVWLKWKIGPREWQIDMSDPAFMDQTGRSMHLENPSDPHNQFITTNRMMPLLSKPVGEGKVNVQAYQYIYKGTYGNYQGTSDAEDTHVDLLSLAPATIGHRCYVLLAYNFDLFEADSNPIETFVSTSQTGDLDSTDIQQCVDQMPPNSRAIWAYRVDNGWTAADVVGHADDRDLRDWPGVPQYPIAITSDDASVTIVESPAGTFDLSVDTGGMEGFTIEGDSGDVIDVIDATPLILEGSGGITVITDDATKTVTIDGSGITGGITELTGDVTASGSGSQVATLATVNADVGSYTYASITVNDKGLITAAASGTAPITSVTETTNYLSTSTASGAVTIAPTAGLVPARVVATHPTTPSVAELRPLEPEHIPFIDTSKLTSGQLPIARGGTGQATQTAAFDALSPLTTQGDILYHNGTNNVRLPKGTATQQIRMNAGATAPEWFTPFSASIAILRDEKSSGTNGGTSSDTTWNARDLNTELYDPDGIVSISSNQFTPIAGDYEVWVFAPFFGSGTAVSGAKCRLYNVTGAASVEEGMSTFSQTSAPGLAILNCKITANGTDAYRIDLYTSLGRAGNGLGRAVSDGSAEVYTQIELRKIS